MEFYIFWSFEIVSNFGFRASNFLLLAAPSTLLRTCFTPLRERYFFRSLFHPKFQISPLVPSATLTGAMKGQIYEFGNVSDNSLSRSLAFLKNRHAVAGKKNIEIERQERSHALAQARGIIHHLFRKQLAPARRVADHGIADDQDFSLRPMKHHFARRLARRANDNQGADLITET